MVRGRILGLVVVLLALAALVPTAHGAVGAQLVVPAPWPAAFAFAPDGRIFYAERFTGEIRIFNPSNGNDTLFFTLPNVVGNGEQGVLGLALNPSYPAKPYVYAYYTKNPGSGVKNVIARLTDSMGQGQALKNILKLPAASIHNGGVIHFGPDNRLYAVVGEFGNRANAQNLNSLGGKILRMTALGKRPSDNPFPGSLAYAYGVRNSFGFAFDPETGNLWEEDNGPECNDELNLVPRGGNLAWGPNATCGGSPPQNTNQDGPMPRTLPLAWYTPTIAPTGVSFCDGCGLAGLDGRLLFGDWNEGDIHAVTLNANRDGIVSQTVVYDQSPGILAVESAPDGRVHFSDSAGIYELVEVAAQP